MVLNMTCKNRSTHSTGIKADSDTFRRQSTVKTDCVGLASPACLRGVCILLFRILCPLLVIALIGVTVSGCQIEKKAPQSKSRLLDRPYDENVEVPSGDPDFPPLGNHWVVDPDDLVGEPAVRMADETLNDLKSQRIAEIAIVVQKGVKHPVEWSTHYGRWIRLGEAEGSHRNNGIVFLIIPDADRESGRVWYSIGRGLPKLTSSDMGPLLEEAASYANADDLDGTVISIARNIHDIVGRIYGRREK